MYIQDYISYVEACCRLKLHINRSNKSLAYSVWCYMSYYYGSLVVQLPMIPISLVSSFSGMNNSVRNVVGVAKNLALWLLSKGQGLLMSVWGWFAGFVNISRDPSGLQLNLVIGLQLKLPVMAAGEIPRKWNFFFVNEFKSIYTEYTS